MTSAYQEGMCTGLPESQASSPTHHLALVTEPESLERVRTTIRETTAVHPELTDVATIVGNELATNMLQNGKHVGGLVCGFMSSEETPVGVDDYCVIYAVNEVAEGADPKRVALSINSRLNLGYVPDMNSETFERTYKERDENRVASGAIARTAKSAGEGGFAFDLIGVMSHEVGAFVSLTGQLIVYAAIPVDAECTPTVDFRTRITSDLTSLAA
jgi:hypothetical protein